jgi:hypothetical protein
MFARTLLCVSLMLFVSESALAQRVELGQGMRSAGLWAFPIVGQPERWLYIPAEARIARDNNGGPQFSFLRFSRVDSKAEAEDTSITEADGGAILTFLIEYHTPANLIARAQANLQEQLGNENIEIRGPIVFENGRYTLVSSILNDNGDKEDITLMTGAAPVLEGNKLALSFELDKNRAAMLMESFQMATPDISLVFDLEFSGLTDAYDAQVNVDWNKMRESSAFKGGGRVLWVKADIGAEFNRLTQNASIDMVSSGESASMEALTARVYEKLLEILFEPIKPERAEDTAKSDLFKSLGKLAKQALKTETDIPTSYWSAHVGYQLKKMRIEGKTLLDFNHRQAVSRHAYVASNIGNLFDQHGRDEDYFRVAQLDCSVFCQRNIVVALDGDLTTDFENMVNSVTVTMRKVHENGEVTLREIVVTPQNLSTIGASQLAYGLNGDTDQDRWMQYEYRTRWSFKGGGNFESEFVTTDEAMIVVFAPYQRQSVQVIDAGADLQGLGVRAVVVGISYPFFGRTRNEQHVIRVGSPESVQFDITLPENVFAYEYNMTWMMENGDRPSITISDNTGLVFLDPPPDPDE